MGLAGRDKRERKFEQNDRLTEAAELMLKFPLTEQKRVVQTDDNGREAQIAGHQTYTLPTLFCYFRERALTSFSRANVN